jgi:hypothetical protein
MACCHSTHSSDNLLKQPSHTRSPVCTGGLPGLPVGAGGGGGGELGDVLVVVPAEEEVAAEAEPGAGRALELPNRPPLLPDFFRLPPPPRAAAPEPAAGLDLVVFSRLLEHWSHTRAPHARQWWRRFDIVKRSTHSRHTCDALSSTQLCTVNHEHHTRIIEHIC